MTLWRFEAERPVPVEEPLPHIAPVLSILLTPRSLGIHDHLQCNGIVTEALLSKFGACLDECERATHGFKTLSLVLRRIWVNKDCEIWQTVIVVNDVLEVGALLLARRSPCVRYQLHAAHGSLQGFHQIAGWWSAVAGVDQVHEQISVLQEPSTTLTVEPLLIIPFLKPSERCVQDPIQCMHLAKAILNLTKVEHHCRSQSFLELQRGRKRCDSLEAHLQRPLMQVSRQNLLTRDASMKLPDVDI
mmetsp:Transcript_19954/g.46427  ORF Transcript_19954/g.46427 Transcript_19954/m.46427 type:complete len:245 (+) Transcript_19954:945-1679(+)